jgi:hypothetical protein
MRKLAPLVLAALALAGCGGSKKSQQTTTTAAAPAPTVPAGRCTAVPAALLARIRRGILLEGGKVLHAEAVRSTAVPQWYFISARVPGLGVATWAANGLEAPTQIAAVDPNARQVSEFGSGLKHKPPLTTSMPGAAESRACATGAGA